MRYWRLARLCADGVCGCCCSMELRLVGRTGVPPRRLLLSRIAFATTRLAILRCISCESACCLAISCATLYQRSRLYPYASSASIRYLRSQIESFIRLFGKCALRCGLSPPLWGAENSQQPVKRLCIAPRARTSWYVTCLEPPWALLPLEPRVRPLVGHFGLASIGTERTPHRPAYIIG